MAIRRYRWQEIGGLLCLGLLYAIVAKIVLTSFSEANSGVSLVWFSGGIGLAVLLLKGMHYWPGIFLGAFAAGLMVDDAFWMSVFIAAGNTLESVAAAWWLKRDGRFSPVLSRPEHFFRLSYAAAACSLISAVLGPWAIWWGGLIPTPAMPKAMLHWWMADVFGIVFTTPVILVWRRWPHEWFRRTRLLETLSFMALCLFIGQFLFLGFFPFSAEVYPNTYWFFPCMIWGALRFGRHGVMWVATLGVLMGLYGAAHLRGVFANDFQQSGMLNFWFFMAVLSFTGTLLVLALQSNLYYARVLHGSQRRLQAIIDATPIPCALNDDRQRITLLNPAFVKTFGYTLDDIPTLEDWFTQAYPEPAYRQWVKDTWRQRLRQAKQSGLPLQPFQKKVVCKNGEIRQVLAGAGPLEGAYENEYLVTLMDLTEQSRINKALSDANVLLQTVLETLPLRVFWKDRQSRYLGGNRLFAEDAGLAAVDDLLGKNDHQLGWWAQAEQYQADDRQVMETGQGRVGYEEPQTRPNGEKIWLRTSKLPLRNSDGEVIGVLGIYEDISMRKRIDDQLLWRTTFLEALLEATPDGILAVDETGNKLLQNRRLSELWDIPPGIAEQADDSLQLEFVKNKTRNPRQFLEKVSFLYAHPEETSRDEIELVDGKLLKRFSAPVRDRLGHYYGRIWYFTDITEMRKGELSLRQQEYYQRSLLDNFPFLVWLKDRESRYLAVNRTFAQQCRIGIQDVIGKTDFDIFPADLAQGYRRNDEEVMASRQRKHIEESLLVDGCWRWMETYKAPLIDDKGEVLGTVGFSRDISPRKESEEALKLAALVFDNSSEAMLVTDAENKILKVNAAFTQITGYSFEEVRGQDPKILASGLQDQAFYRAMWDSINATGGWRGEIINRRKTGEIYIEEITINSIFDDQGRPQRRVALFSDITQRKQSEEQIWQQAYFDPLTGLPNRRLMRERLAQEIKKAQRMQQRFGLLFIDLDHFKDVNDTLGHEMGDELLKEAGRRLSASVRESDTVARLGGDEFTVILGEMASLDGLERVAKLLIQRLSEPFTLSDEVVFVSASIGITLYPDDGLELGQLLRNADQAMYAAKNLGRNRYSFFTAAMQEALTARAAMVTDLRGALANQEFGLVYQPIVELSSGAVHKAEALLRWQHPERGGISPAEFVPLAEDAGLIHEIGDWVFQTASRQVARWRQILHPDFQISVNKSPQQFLDSRHGALDWLDWLRRLELPGNAVAVEITEGLLLEANTKASEHLLVFRDAGVQVAIDDFGTGYSSLAYLKKFDIDYLKIDQSFVSNLSADSSDFVLCQAIIVMAHKLGLKVIAEGVETEAQRDLLNAIGCDYAQGYLFAQPMTVDEFERRFVLK
ncbi:EAL domain-containing protein [Methylomonas rapida]|uniref:EAL domain-containing protein n=1 Tax=Methylomonas rapida TaxID=2963939 RepID=A0ABY7GM10_9GAMM|nr:EAL domain-containing protein [Methylomonas rapida]WAR45542.1 EAL domain-containing protein [Methylomonas rapida]